MALATAIRLAAENLNVEVVGMPPPPAPKPSSSALSVITTTALALSSMRFLRSIGIEVSAASGAIHHIIVKDERRLASLDFHRDEVPYGEPFGNIIDNRLLWRKLYQRAAADERIRLSIGGENKIEGFAQTAYQASVKLASSANGAMNGEEKSAPLVIAADGRGSVLRQLGGFATINKDYRQEAIQCVIAHRNPHGQTAWECFLRGGPLALLPMADPHRSAVVWSLPDCEGGMLAANHELLEESLSHRVTELVGECRLVGAPVVRKLGLVHATTPTSGRLALVGDAACSIHPIAGQGFNLALRGVEILATAIAEAKGLGLEAAAGLKQYAARQQTSATAMAAATDLLNRLFCYQLLPLAAVRGLGVWLVGKVPPLKRAFIRTAMGVSVV